MDIISITTCILLIFTSVIFHDFQSVSGMCIKREREALLKFKQGLNGPLSSWGGQDECCEWYGVECSNATGHVTAIKVDNLQGNITIPLLQLQHLNHLELTGGDFGGNEIPEFIGSIKTLEYISLEGSNLAGLIPPQLWNLTNLRVLDLSNNKLTGSLPESLSRLSKLEEFDVSHNSLEGIVSEAHFMELRNLSWLALSSNKLNVQLGADWIPPFNLVVMDLARCGIGPSFPLWLQTQTSFAYLDISDNRISDEAPKWLWNLSDSYFVQYLNISNNQIGGVIPDFVGKNIVTLDISFNNFSGPLPPFHPRTYELHFNDNAFKGSISYICTYSSKIYLLDLSNNLLSGVIPDCWENMTDVFVLNLSNNSFSGEIPSSFGSLRKLATLHLRYNKLSGELPSTLKNCQSLLLIDVGGNELTGHIPSWIGGTNYTNMTLLNLRQNRFYGGIPPEICNLSNIQILDLAGNHISGEIPQCFNNFMPFVDENYTSINSRALRPRIILWYDSRLYSQHEISRYIDYALVQWKDQEREYRKNLLLLKLLDLSSNRLVGSIPESFSNMRGLISLNLSSNRLIGNIIPNIGQMEVLEVLDLSRNQLSGGIPTSMAQLSFLAVVDLAWNNLLGEIPSSTQLQGLDASAYAGNNGLCGRPLPPCHVNTPINDQPKSYNNKDVLEEFWIPLVFGAIVGFWGFVGSLVLKRSWRYAYFNLLNVVGGWLYVNVAMFFISKF